MESFHRDPFCWNRLANGRTRHPISMFRSIRRKGFWCIRGGSRLSVVALSHTACYVRLGLDSAIEAVSPSKNWTDFPKQLGLAAGPHSALALTVRLVERKGIA